MLTGEQVKAVKADARSNSRVRVQVNLAVLLFGAALMLGLIFRLYLISEKEFFEYDDAISLMTATGHAGGNEGFPARQWVSAQTWLRYLQPEAGHGFQKIGFDLAHEDAHPPLYYWILYIWMHLTGVNFWSGPVLNLIFDVFGALVLYRLALGVFNRPLPAALTTAVWFLSPIALKTALWVRGYSFFTLLTITFVYLLYQWLKLEQVKRKSLPLLMALLVVTTAGYLAHYYFFIFVGIGLLWVLWDTFSQAKNLDKLILYILVTGYAGIFFVVLHPHYFYALFSAITYNTGMAGGGQANGASRFLADLLYRVGFLFKAAGLLLTPALLALLALALAMVSHWIRRPAEERGLGSSARQVSEPRPQATVFWMLAFGILPWAASLVLYMLHVSPPQAMSARYISFFAPFLMFLPAVLLEKLAPGRAAYIGMASLVLGLAVFSTWKDRSLSHFDGQVLSNASVVVIDNDARGVWPSILYYLKEDTQVYIAEQDELLQDPAAWLPQLTEQGGMFVSFVRGEDANLEGRKALLELLNPAAEVKSLTSTRRPGEFFIVVYSVLPK